MSLSLKRVSSQRSISGFLGLSGFTRSVYYLFLFFNMALTRAPSALPLSSFITRPMSGAAVSLPFERTRSIFILAMAWTILATSTSSTLPARKQRLHQLPICPTLGKGAK